MNDFARQIYDNLVAACSCSATNCDECSCSHWCDKLMECAETMGREFEREGDA